MGVSAFRRVCCGLLMFAGVPVWAQGDVAYQRAEHLQHGVNTSIWFAQAPGRYTEDRLKTFTTDDDLVLIHALGFDHVRVSIDPDPLVLWERNDPQGVMFMAHLDHVVKAATDLGLAVIVDVHPEEAYKAKLLQGSESVQQFAALWRALAGHFAGTDPKLVLFEVMNEPEQTDPYRWEGIQLSVGTEIRRVAPEHTLILCGDRWSGLAELLGTEPVGLPNVIYTFHDYDPFVFTHQGATWAGADLVPLRQVPYPATPEMVKANVAQESGLGSQFFVEEYALEHWNAARMDGTLAYAERWSQAHHVPVYVGEFGVLRTYAPATDRARWITDMRTMMEKHHLGWAMWDYQTNFGLVTKQDGKTTVDAAVGRALGLDETVVAAHQ
jgi:endoglucanase